MVNTVSNNQNGFDYLFALNNWKSKSEWVYVADKQWTLCSYFKRSYVCNLRWKYRDTDYTVQNAEDSVELCVMNALRQFDRWIIKESKK